MKVGDLVSWWGTTRKYGMLQHAGKIVQVVQPGKRPSRRWKLADPGAARSEISYVVRHGENGRCYWPRRSPTPITAADEQDVLDRQARDLAHILVSEDDE